VGKILARRDATLSAAVVFAPLLLGIASTHTQAATVYLSPFDTFNIGSAGR